MARRFRASSGVEFTHTGLDTWTHHAAEITIRWTSKNMDPKAPVEVARFLDVRKAEFAVSVLKGSNIEAFIDQPFTGSIAPQFMLNRAGIRLFVAAQSKQRALDVLASIEPERSGLPE